MDRAARSLCGNLDAPPRWHRRLKVVSMSGASNDGHPIKYGIIGARLARQTLESVGVAFDLVSVKTAVYDRNVDACGAVRDSEFVDNQGIRIACMFPEHLPA
jgi:hypothetical protein